MGKPETAAPDGMTLRLSLLTRLTAGPASMDDLIETACRDGVVSARNTVTRISVRLNRLAQSGAPIVRRLGDKRYELTGPVPAHIWQGLSQRQYEREQARREVQAADGVIERVNEILDYGRASRLFA